MSFNCLFVYNFATTDGHEKDRIDWSSVSEKYLPFGMQCGEL